LADDLALDTRAEAEKTPQEAVRRWLLEIRLAEKREKLWREKAKKTLEAYRGKDRRKNSFNILWSNTEVLRPALYNSPPKPDVRRRFRQDDPLGKAVSEVMERSLSYCTDAYDLDNCLQNDVLDALLPGRGISRVRYVPKFKQIPSVAPELPAGQPEAGEARTAFPAAQQPAAAEGAEQSEAQEGTREEVEYEQALCDHVQWDDLLHGPGKVWEEVQWCGFRARLTRDDLVEKFGEVIGKKITLNDVDDDDINSAQHGDSLKDVFKRAEVWEIWDKAGKKVFFVNESYKDGLIYAKDAPNGEPPLELKNFFPIPRPLQLMEDTGNLVPEPLYEQYRMQAEEVDRLSTRINKIINACRVRFIHDSTLSELKALMDSGDNEGIPTEQARAWMQNGGIEKAIWFMPVQQVAAVLKELYVARDAAKQAVYEITGISDIIRGATNPNETLGAQQLKANSSSLRLQRMKVEVQRYARDLLRLLAEVIGENFDPQTLAQMTGLQFPRAQDKQVLQLRMQAIQQRLQAPQAPGQPPAPPPPEVMQQMAQAQHVMSLPTWEDIKAVISNDMQREYRVDVETDSTVAQSLQQDMEGLKEVLTGVVEFWQGVGPAVMQGAISMDAVKAITMSIVRRARMGLEVEDALEAGMQQPKPQDNGEAAKQAAEAEKEKASAARDAAKAQADAQAQAAKEQEITKREQIASQEKIALDQQQKQAEDLKHQRETAQQDAFERWKVEEDNKTKIRVAEISAGAVLDKAQIEAANAAEEDTNAELSDAGAEKAAAKTKRRATPIDRMEKMHGETMQAHGKMIEHVANLATVLAADQVPERDNATGRVLRLKRALPQAGRMQ
jgi:hypothetical protein